MKIKIYFVEKVEYYWAEPDEEVTLRGFKSKTLKRLLEYC